MDSLKAAHKVLTQRPRLAWAAGLLLLAAIAGVEFASRVESGFGVCYLLPVSLVAWYRGRRAGLGMGLAAAAAWGSAASLSRLFAGLSLDAPLISIWSGLAGLGINTVFVLILTALKNALARERELQRLKSDLLSVVSHEFNNSLTTMGMALLLLKDHDDDPEQQRKVYLVLDRIHRVLKTTVGNFLNQARMQSGRFQLDIKRIELRRLVGEVLELMRPLAEQKKIDLRLDFPEEVIPVNADPDAVVLVLSNLIGNAIKYTLKSGRVTVSLELAGDDMARVCVEDTGIGIAPQDQEAIFSGFYRTKEGKKEAKGYGLGLMVSRQILESHGSALKLDSEPGRGSRFHFDLPICPADCPHRDAGQCHRCRRRNPLAEENPGIADNDTTITISGQAILEFDKPVSSYQTYGGGSKE